MAAAKSDQCLPGQGAAARAFTLLEVLVALAILLALVAISLPVANLVKARGLVSHCANNLSQLHKATVMYADDHTGLLPCHPLQTRYWVRKPGEGGSTFPPPTHDDLKDYPPPYDNLKCFIVGRPRLWRDALNRYVRSKDAFWCIADRNRGNESFAATQDGPNDFRSQYTSYEMHIGIQRCTYEGNNGTLRLRLQGLKPDTHYLNDASWLQGDPLRSYTCHGRQRHNILFMDGHVKFWTW